jgi:hypothetical protein
MWSGVGARGSRVDATGFQLHIIRDVTSVIHKKLQAVAPRVREKEDVPATLHPSRFCLSLRLFIRFVTAIFFP